MADCGSIMIKGFVEAMDRAQYYVDRFGVPICDFQTFDYSWCLDYFPIKYKKNVVESFRRAVNRALVITKLQKPKKDFKIFAVLRQLKEMK